MPEIAIETAQRLHSFSTDLQSDIVQYVAQRADFGRSLGSAAMHPAETLTNEDIKQIEYGGCPPVQILDIRPVEPRNMHAATVVWLPMARGFDPAELWRAGRLRRVLPDERIIIVANPDSWWKASGILNSDQRARVRGGDVRPVISTVLHYLKEMGLSEVNHVGNSYGAKLAMAAAALAVKHAIHKVPHVVSIEAPHSISRSLRDLALTFYSTRHGVQAHKNTLTDEALIAALHKEKRLWPYIGTLASLTNLAITKSLTYGQLEEDMSAILEGSPDTVITAAWGTKSELVPHGHMMEIAERLRQSYGDRFKTIVLEGLRHAMYYDIDLVIALIMQGLQVPVNDALAEPHDT